MIQATTPRTQASEDPDTLTRPTRILVVEDERDLRDAIRTTLLNRGFEVDSAGNGWVAVEMAFRNPYDLVVTDIRMPHMDGLALARSLRSRTHPPLVIILTAYLECKAMQDARDAGVVEVVAKPIDLHKLADRIARRVSAKGTFEAKVFPQDFHKNRQEDCVTAPGNRGAVPLRVPYYPGKECCP